VGGVDEAEQRLKSSCLQLICNNGNQDGAFYMAVHWREKIPKELAAFYVYFLI
jgi:hypothetical protein